MPAILSIVTFLPLVGAAVLLGARFLSKTADEAAPAARWIALGTTLLTLAVSVVLVMGFDQSSSTTTTTTTVNP